MKYAIKLLNKQMILEYKESFLGLMKELVGNRNEREVYCVKKYEDMLKFQEDKTAVVAGAFVEKQLVAYAWGYHRELENIERMHITQIVVSKQYRHQRIGENLLSYMKQYAEKQGWKKLELNVRGNNYVAQDFYKKNGFVCEHLFLTKNVE